MLSPSFLFIDDDSDDTELFQEALSEVDASAKFFNASNGIKGLSKLEEIEKPKIIFLDVNMPEMGGFDFLATIKNQQQYKDIPVLIYTTSSSRQDIQTAGKLGALCFITKPTDFNQLKEILQKVIDHIQKDAYNTLCQNISNISFCI
ncbi:MAG: response regulator [Flavobacterium sp.]